MAKNVVLAVAGAGKTYHICRVIDPLKKNLILAFTHENVRNIYRELLAAHGNIPTLTTVMTFDAFVYRFFVCPYFPTIARFFNRVSFAMQGITLTKPPDKGKKLTNGGYCPNPAYIKDKELEHYFNKLGQVYNAYTSKLVMRVKKGRDSLINRASQMLNQFFDKILIDEFQDFREYDYDLIMTLSKSIDNILLVGDYYQHSVSAVNNTGKPFTGKNKVPVTYNDFVSSVKKNGFEVDKTTLDKSRRCPIKICDFVRDKFGIEIHADNSNSGGVIWLESDIEAVLDNDKIMKLVYKNSAKYSFWSQNWSYSKGNTFDEVCVILTKELDELNNSSFNIKKMAVSTVNMLYVALTRTKGNLYIITDRRFQSVKKKYFDESEKNA